MMKFSTLLLLVCTCLLLSSCEIQTTEEEQAAIRASIEEKVTEKVALAGIATLADAGAVTTISVDGMVCANCSMKLYDSLTTLPGFVAEESNWETGEVKIGFQNQVPEATLIQVAVESAGFTLGEATATPAVQ